jgi:hypothetical protein
MRRDLIATFVGLKFVLLLVTGSLLADSLPSYDGKYNILQLYAEAEAAFDLSIEDAIILLDSRYIKVEVDGSVRHDVHRIIWINEDRAVSRYGDHRIPYDSERTELLVHALRTWCDGRWWETGPTGKVETLPYALSDAFDYTNLREMMLLHNGIELPCFLEIVYSIVDLEPYRRGTEYLWLFPKVDPIVRSEFKVWLPAGKTLNASASSGVDYQLLQSDGKDIYSWSMGPLSALPYPLPDDPASFAPHVQWSTWESWKQLGNFISEVFDSNSALSNEITSELDSVLSDTRGDMETIELIAGFVSDRIEYVGYDSYFFWPTARQAHRTYETSYAASLDRAILAASLFSYAGLTAIPVFIGPEGIPLDHSVPSLYRFSEVNVGIIGYDFEATYDPDNSSITYGISHQIGRSVWKVRHDDKPVFISTEADGPASFRLLLNLTYNVDDTVFTGNGSLHADGCFSPYSEITGFSNRSKEFLGSLVSSVLEGAEVVNYNLAKLDPLAISAGFEIRLPVPEPDDFDRILLAIREPSAGLISLFQQDVHLFSQSREAPISLSDSLVETVTIKIETEGLEITRLPSEVNIRNNVGTFSLEIAEDEDEVTFVRRISFDRPTYNPDEWQELRTLMLEYERDHNQIIFLTHGSDSTDKE